MTKRVIGTRWNNKNKIAKCSHFNSYVDLDTLILLPVRYLTGGSPYRHLNTQKAATLFKTAHNDTFFTLI